MTEPSGYTALDLIGFTDKGEYDAATNYVRNDVAHYDNTAWLCLIDDTVGVTPVEGNYWTVFIDGSDSYTKTETDSAISAAINALDVTDSAVNGSYVKAVSETNGKISVTREAADTSPTASSTKMVTSGGVYTALSAKADQTTIGDSYNASTTYAVDDRFVYSGVRYKVLVACTGITPPNANYYSVLPIDDDTAALESEIDTLNSSLTNCLDLVVNNGAVNICENIFTSQTLNGLTFTNNSDGSLTVSGTASANTGTSGYSGGYIFNTTLNSGTYTFSIGQTTRRIFYSINGTSAQIPSNGTATFTISSDNTVFQAWFYCASGYEANETYYPMLTRDSYSGSYVPYAMTNQQITDIVNCPSNTDGTYTLQATVSSGTVTYSWVASS